MRKTTIVPKAHINFHVVAGAQIEAVVVDGKLYLEAPYQIPTEDAPASKKSTSKSVDEDDEEESSPAPKAKTTSPSKDSKIYTEDELMDTETFSVDDLLKICKERGIDVPKEGKNTNKKIRILILADQKESGTSAPAAKKSSAVATDSIQKIVESYDAGDIDDEEAITKLTKEYPEGKKVIRKIIEKMVDDTDFTAEEAITQLRDELSDSGEEAEEEEAPKSAKKTKPVKKEEELVDAEDLTVGDKVAVYWVSYDDWFDGEVSSIKKGKVIVTYDADGDEEAIDESEHTKIKLIG